MTTLILTVLAVCLYFIPYFEARHRKHRNKAAIGALNLLLGWTLIGWAVALVWALMVDRSEHDAVRAH